MSVDAETCAWCSTPVSWHDVDELAECRAHLAESEDEPDEKRDEVLRATAADEAHDAAREDDREELWA